MLWGVSALKCSIFQKIWVFQIFDGLNLLLDRLKMRYNLWLQSAWLDRCSINARSIEYAFRSIEVIFRPIEFQSEGVLKLFSHVFFIPFKTFQTLFWLFFFDRSNLSQICRFLPKISQGFLSSYASKSLLPFLFH